MKYRSKYLILLILLLFICSSLFTYALFRSNKRGNANINAAKWNIVFKNGEDVISNNFNISLENAEWTNPLGNVATGKIAPGSYATFYITLDATDTETDVDYVAQIDSSFNLTSFSVSLLEDSGTIHYSTEDGAMVKQIPIMVVWNGNIDDNDDKNNIDFNLRATNIDIPITITAAQKIKSKIIVTLDNGNLIYGLKRNQDLRSEERMNYSVSNGIIEVTARNSDGFGYTSGRVYLEKDKTYIFNCETDGIWNSSVETFIMLNGETSTYYLMNSNINYEFTPSTTGIYWIRLDVNNGGETKHFWNMSFKEKTNNSIELTYSNLSYSNLPIPVQNNYTFKEWNTKEDGTGITVTNNSNLVEFDDHTLYAIWKDKVQITNLIEDGSFENSGWTGDCIKSSDDKYFGNYSCYITAATVQVERMSSTRGTAYLTNSHKYYVSVYSKSSLPVKIEMFWPIVGGQEISFEPPMVNEWSKRSKIITKNYSSGAYNFRIDFNNERQSGYVYYDGLLLIDLTAAFGSGNEPDIEWCDTNLNYFEGTKFIDI